MSFGASVAEGIQTLCCPRQLGLPSRLRCSSPGGLAGRLAPIECQSRVNCSNNGVWNCLCGFKGKLRYFEWFEWHRGPSSQTM